MGEPPCDAMSAELALDLVMGELAAELPAHVRAFARAHADGRAAPAAPLVARLTSTLQAARDACAFDELRDRALALLRLVAPLVVEDEPAVSAARRAAPSWPALVALARARDAASLARLGRGALAWTHVLHGCAGEAGEAAIAGPPARTTTHELRIRFATSPPPVGDGDAEPLELPAPRQAEARPATAVGDDTRLPAPLAGWQARGSAVDDAAVSDAWQAIAARLGVTGAVRVDRGAPGTRPRAFVVEPRREVLVVVPAVLDTPAARFAVLHELGHAAAGLALAEGLPRAVDEGAAAYVARFAESAAWLPARWCEPLAGAARARRVQVAVVLDRIERALPSLDDAAIAAIAATIAEVPWSLWHDPGAQAAYVAAEAVADRLHGALGPSPPRGQFAAVLATERDRIDRGVRL
nr:hypothetical protein [Kofleriaceae bacterium]